MKQILTAATLVAGLAVFGGGAGADEMRVAPSLTSFGAVPSNHALTATDFSAAAVQTLSFGAFAQDAAVMPVRFGGDLLPPSFAASTALTINLALDSGYNLDLARRFDNYDALQSPLINRDNFLGLANGGRYAGVTFEPSPDLRLRLGTQYRDDRLDDPARGVQQLPLTWNDGQQHSLLAGVSWDFAEWAGLSLSGIVSDQKGAALDAGPLAALIPSSTTSALNVAAHVDFGSGWVTMAAFSNGLTQLDQKSGTPTSLDTHSYSIAVAKHGVFGQDALGFSFSRPSPGLLDNGFETVAAGGDVPPAFVAGRMPTATPETDLQLGYVTSFLDGALALQANAAYQMNYQGQTGANSVSVLSRAKIKF